MKNADRTAMPNRSQSPDNVFGGLTKREMFAMHAPSIPDWFVDEWIYNDGNYRLGGSHELVGNNRGANLDIKEMMNITKEWRYAYADTMLGD